MNASYEEHLALVGRLERPASDNDRHISWLTDHDAIGLARTPQGLIEIFLPGPPLQPRLRRVRDALEHQTWLRGDDQELLANRILLPAAGHFEQVAAFLSVELMRNGADTDLPQAFAQTEPLIEMAIEDLLIADETLLGLTGELLTLHAMLELSPTERAHEVIDSWKGYRETSRDFQLCSTGLEVKTTTGGTSSHLFRGVHQLEIAHGVDGVEEARFVLLSIGLERTSAAETTDTTSLPELVDRCIQQLERLLRPDAGATIDELLERVAAYGSPTALGYRHRSMADSPRFSRRFRVVFARGYDMTDPNLHLLTSDDMRARPLIDADSLRLRVNFQERITGDLNPTQGLNATVARVLALA